MELIAAGAPPLAVAAAANYDARALPTDVLQDILLRLPAHEVCRLRLVCRSWRSLTSDPLFAAAHASRHPHVIVTLHREGRSHDEVAEVRAVDLHGNVIKRRRIRPIVLGRMSMDGDLLCASHGWGQDFVVDMVTDGVVVEHQRKVDAARRECVLGHVPATGEYKVFCIQTDRCYSSRRPRQTSEVMTLGGGGGRWRQTPRPPVNLSTETWPCRGNMTVVAGLAYFLVRPCLEDEPKVVEADRIAVFDLATEVWKPATLQGPLSSSLLARGRGTNNDEEEEHDDDDPMPILRRERFQLARLGESLVVLYCNIENCSTELWFLEGMEDDMAAQWTRRYTLQRTPFGKDEFFFLSLKYHYPLAILDDGRILVWVDRTSKLCAYDPKTCTWTDLATLKGGFVVGIHHGSLLCSNVGAVQP